MMTFHKFGEFAPAVWLTLLNDPDIQRHMPLNGPIWDVARAEEWSAGKDRQWSENGYGPWAIGIDGSFAGWGGFQKEGVEADFALVLLPRYWGMGRRLHDAMVRKGFDELGLASFTILLPPTRVHLRGLERLGYKSDGELEYDNHQFLRFRLHRPRP